MTSHNFDPKLTHPPTSVTLKWVFYLHHHTACHKYTQPPPPTCVTSFMNGPLRKSPSVLTDCQTFRLQFVTKRTKTQSRDALKKERERESERKTEKKPSNFEIFNQALPTSFQTESHIFTTNKETVLSWAIVLLS